MARATFRLVKEKHPSDPAVCAWLAGDAERSGDFKAAAAEILEGLEGEALEEMRAANDVNLRMAPLTPDHHFYIDQGANAHVRLVLIAIGKKLVAQGVLDAVAALQAQIAALQAGTISQAQIDALDVGVKAIDATVAGIAPAPAA